VIKQVSVSVTIAFRKVFDRVSCRIHKLREKKVTDMMQLKKGMLVLSQMERTADRQWGKPMQQRVVLVTRISQELETQDRRFQRGMMVGSVAKARN
jgi:hypothetical protein